MGNQGLATEGLRRAVELVWAGTLGEMRECHIWLAGGDGPQERPKDEPPVPEGLHWDLWLGPAPQRPYHPAYVPGSWRRWRAFGSGSGGDMGCHTSNLAFRALRLDLLWNPDAAAKSDKPAIIRVQAEASEIHPETYPRHIKAKFDIPARQASARDANLVQRRAEAAQGSASRSYHDRMGLPGQRQARGHLVQLPLEHAVRTAAQSAVRGVHGTAAKYPALAGTPRRVDSCLQRRFGPETVFQFRHRRPASRDGPTGPCRHTGRQADRIRSAVGQDHQRARSQCPAAPRISNGLDALAKKLGSLTRHIPQWQTGR